MAIDDIQKKVYEWLTVHGCQSILSGVVMETYEVRDLTTNEKLVFHPEHLETIPAGYGTDLTPDFESEILGSLYSAIDTGELEIY